MTMKTHLAFVLAAGMTAAPLTAQTRPAQEFCRAAQEYGARSWQALSEYDAAAHGGVNLYRLAPAQRDAAINRMLASSPPPVRDRLRTTMKSRLERFDAASKSQKLIIMVQELQHHGVNLNQTDALAAECN